MTAVKAERKPMSKTAKALNEVGRRIQAFARLTNDPAAVEAYRTALQVIVEVRDAKIQASKDE